MAIAPDSTSVFLLAAAFAAGALLTALVLQLRHGRAQAVAATERNHWAAGEARLREELAAATARNAELASAQAALAARLDSERQRFQKQLQLLTAARESLTREFENLANRIFDDKQAVFARTSKQTLDITVDPLRRELGEFRKQVEDAYAKESAERNRLVQGRGNLVKRLEDIRLLGARTRRQLPAQLREDSLEQNETSLLAPNPAFNPPSRSPWVPLCAPLSRAAPAPASRAEESAARSPVRST